MTRNKQPFNPFYVLLVVVGIVFVVTACAYTVMTVTAVRTGALPAPGQPGHDLMEFINRNGLLLLRVEIALLAVSTVLAIGVDHFWGRRQLANEPRAKQP